MTHWLRRHRFLLCFVLITSLAGLSVGVARVATTLYAVQLNASETLLGVIAGVQSLGLLFMALPVGVMVDQRGPTRLYVVGSIVAGLIYVATPAVASGVYLALCTALVSFCMPFRFVALNTVFMQQLEQVGLSKAGWFRATHMTGFYLLGPMAAVVCIGAVGYAPTYWLIGAMFFITAAMAPSVMTYYARHKGPRPTLNAAELRSQLWLLGRDEDLRRVCVIEFAIQSIAQFYSFVIVVLAVSVYKLGSAEAASLCTAHGAMFITALLFAGGAMQRLGAHRFLAGGYGLVLGALTVLAFARGSIGLWAGSLALGIGLGALQTVALAQFARISLSAGGGRVAGINAFVGPAGGLVGSLLGGALGNFFGLQAVFLLFVPVFAWLAWRMWSDRGLQAPKPCLVAEGESES